jgi:hypothetical protein
MMMTNVPNRREQARQLLLKVTEAASPTRIGRREVGPAATSLALSERSAGTRAVIESVADERREDAISIAYSMGIVAASSYTGDQSPQRTGDRVQLDRSPGREALSRELIAEVARIVGGPKDVVVEMEITEACTRVRIAARRVV